MTINLMGDSWESSWMNISTHGFHFTPQENYTIMLPKHTCITKDLLNLKQRVGLGKRKFEAQATKYVH